MWTSGKETHNPFRGSATAITITANGNVKYYFRSAIRMHMIWSDIFGPDACRHAAVAEARWMMSILKKAVV